MKLLTCILALGALALPIAANAEGAMALAKSTSGNGFTYGISYNFPTREAAEADAMARCEQGKATYNIPGTCVPITNFSNACVAFAWDQNRNYGWAVRPGLELAKLGALSNCPAGSSCEVKNTGCDGSAR